MDHCLLKVAACKCGVVTGNFSGGEKTRAHKSPRACSHMKVSGAFSDFTHFPAKPVCCKSPKYFKKLICQHASVTRSITVRAGGRVQGPREQGGDEGGGLEGVDVRRRQLLSDGKTAP